MSSLTTAPDSQTVHHGTSKPSALILGALGVAFGDIGTSPLYALQTVFSIDHNEVKPDPLDVYGVLSLVFWSVTLIVSIKYILFILRADNDGEGGVLALAAATKRVVPRDGKRFKVVMTLGVLGTALFYGDSLITPAISVMSSVEGLSVPAPGLERLVLPLSLVIISALFVVQRFGTETVGKLFGPVMVVWFLVIGGLGLAQIVRDPNILKAVSPTYAFRFFLERPFITFVAMGAVVLVVTGAEALYADMGHFGRGPIAKAWFGLVFPALLLNYMGQGSLILNDPSASRAPFFLLAPGWAQWPLVVLATMATVIASQAVISGAYSVTRLAERLGFLPRLTVHHTSPSQGGQIYLPMVNWVLYAGVILLMLGFRSSERLATAYGLAVVCTLIITSALFVLFARSAWRWPVAGLAVLWVLFSVLELTFLAANLTKVAHGGWLPLVIALVMVTLMLTWGRGRELVTRRRVELEGPLSDFIDQMRRERPQRVEGTAVFLHPSKETVPLALRENVVFNHVLHEEVVIVTTEPWAVPHVPAEQRTVVDDLGDAGDGVRHVTLRFGFRDDQDVPGSLADAHEAGLLPVDPTGAIYFLSRISVHRQVGSELAGWRQRLFVGMSHNAANPTEYFKLPTSRTVVMGAQVKL